MQRSHAANVRGHPRERRSGLVKRPLALVPGLLALALAAFGRPGAPDVPDVSYTVTRLSSRVIVLDCQDVNVTAIAAKSGIVVIDTNRSPGVMRRLRRVIEEEFGRSDFIDLVNTHGDPDHSSGNQVFPSVPLIAHQDYAAFILHGKASKLRHRWSQRSRLEDARARCDALDPQSPEAESLRTRVAALESANADLQDGRAVKIPAVTFEDSLHLDLGDLTLELRFCGEAHTNHDIVVYVPEEKLLLAGDLICSAWSPCFSINAMADVPRLVGELEGLLQREAGLETVVPGHGKTLTRADLSSFCRSLGERYGEVRAENSAARIVSQTIEREGIQAALKRCPWPAPDGRGTLDWSAEEFGTLGIRLMRRGKVDEAVSVLRLAVRALPQSAYLYDCLGEACLEKDDRAAAAAAYERSLALMPDNRRAEEMVQILRGGD
jgi:glyoxylase-like metal-dependent hydrolase (beta-lactamase superfamily II)